MPPLMDSSSSSDEERDVEKGNKKSYEQLDEDSTVKKTTGLQRFLESPAFNTVIVVGVILHVLFVILVTTFVDSVAESWMIRLGYAALLFLFLQVIEVVMRVVAFVRTIWCRFGDILDFFLVSICFSCALFASGTYSPSSDSSSADEEEEEECIEASPFLVFSAIIFLRLWRFGKIMYMVHKEENKSTESETQKINNNPTNQPQTPKSRLFDKEISKVYVNNHNNNIDEDKEKRYEEKIRKLELDKAQLTLELRQSNEYICNMKQQMSEVYLKESPPASTRQLTRSTSGSSAPSLSYSDTHLSFIPLPSSTSSPSLLSEAKSKTTSSSENSKNKKKKKKSSTCV